MTLTKDAKGRIRHEKYSPVEQSIVCSKCGIPTMYSKAPLKAIENIIHKTKTIKNRKTGEIAYTQTNCVSEKTGEYICQNCA